MASKHIVVYGLSIGSKYGEHACRATAPITPRSDRHQFRHNVSNRAAKLHPLMGVPAFFGFGVVWFPAPSRQKNVAFSTFFPPSVFSSENGVRCSPRGSAATIKLSSFRCVGSSQPFFRKRCDRAIPPCWGARNCSKISGFRR